MFKKFKTDHASCKQGRSFLKDESGASAIEYGLILGLIFLVVITAWQRVGTAQEEQYDKISTAVDDATS